LRQSGPMGRELLSSWHARSLSNIDHQIKEA
jgi:hypothetical protein